PCTGLGVLRRNPDTRWNRIHKDILRLASMQKKMLNAAANLTKPGGILVFAVCSCEKEENEAVIDSFLKKRKDFSIDQTFAKTLKTILKFPALNGYLKTYPNQEDMDGFFAVRLKRKPKP
ncbi:MAG: 16S rRNA (cytosine(967)-C(5))-methyltransferase RsmB, partial [Desulfobacteraceae bacterium]|nr:16S rRNA (cytosine(967)-C(5))-methyltransferase RsmB [Desulfobacteraceae bacterium]